MRAIVYDRYGGPEQLRLENFPDPIAGDGEVLVRIRAAGIATGDRHLLRGEPFLVRLMFGLRRPKVRILGSDIAGTVEAVGSGVRELQVGDDVFGATADAGFGGFAEYVSVPESVLVHKSNAASFEDTAATPGSALTALQGLRDQGGVGPGRHVLINGASGGVGTFAVQIAKQLGAEVTGVCSGRNVELVRSLGADHVIDYTQEDFRVGGERYDVVLDAAAHRPVRDSLRALVQGGTYVFVGGATRYMIQAMLLGPILSRTTGKAVRFFIAESSRDDLLVLREMLDSGTLAPVIDRRYRLDEVPEAIRHLESGRARGKLVVSEQGS